MELIEDAGFSVEWEMAAAMANRQLGFQGTFEEIEAAARLRNFEFRRLVSRQLRRAVAVA